MTERVARLALRIEAGPEADATELAELAVDLHELMRIWIDRHTDR